MSAWADQVWGPVEKNGMARRKLSNVLKYGGWLGEDGMTVLLKHAKRRKFHVAIIGEQVFVFRHPIDVKC